MSNQTKTPAYAQTCALIQKFVDANGIALIPQATVIDGIGGNKNWACYQVQGTEHKLYVPRGQDAVGPLHTTVAVPAGTPGLVDHTKDGKDRRPGKIEAFFSPAPETLENLLVLWAGTSERLRAAKAPVRRAASQPASGERQVLTPADVATVDAEQVASGRA